MSKKLLEQRKALKVKVARLRDEEEKLEARRRDVAGGAMLAAARRDPEAAKAALGMLAGQIKKAGDRQALQPWIEEFMDLASKQGPSFRSGQEAAFSPPPTEGAAEGAPGQSR